MVVSILMLLDERMPEKVPAAAVAAEDPFLVVVSVETGRPEQHVNIEWGKDEEEEVIQLLLGQDDVGGGEVGEGEQTVEDKEREEGHHGRPSVDVSLRGNTDW